jgi:hypothetical protein
MKTQIVLFLTVILLLGSSYYFSDKYKNLTCRNNQLEDSLSVYRDSVRKFKQEIISLEDALYEAGMFELSEDPEATDYLNQNYGTKENWAAFIKQKLLAFNRPGGNRFVPYEGVYDVMKINNIRVINHKWLLADFSDGKLWGQMIMKYEPVTPDSIVFETVESILYPVHNNKEN